MESNDEITAKGGLLTPIVVGRVVHSGWTRLMSPTQFTPNGLPWPAPVPPGSEIMSDQLMAAVYMIGVKERDATMSDFVNGRKAAETLGVGFRILFNRVWEALLEHREEAAGLLVWPPAPPPLTAAEQAN